MMRTLVRSALVLALVATPAIAEAQRPDAPGKRGAPGPHAMNPAAGVLSHRAELGLSADQVARLEAIRAQLEERNRPLLQQLQAQRPTPAEGRARPGQAAGQLTPEQRAEMRQRMEARRAEMQQLTPEQRAERREQMRQLTPEQRRARMEARRAEVERTLTPEQRQRLEAHRAGMEQRREAIQPVMQQLRANQEQAREQTQQVLTAEQQARLQELRAAHPRRGDGPGWQRGQRQGRRSPSGS
jgi:Spy/CpxP family protein refolding chaperone